MPIVARRVRNDDFNSTKYRGAVPRAQGGITLDLDGGEAAADS